MRPVYAPAVPLIAWQWWEDEQERLYTLQRARSMHDAYMTRKHAPKAPLPFYLAKRVSKELALPQVHVAPAVVTGKRRAGWEQEQEQDEERRAVLSYVLTKMNEQLYSELMSGMQLA